MTTPTQDQATNQAADDITLDDITTMTSLTKRLTAHLEKGDTPADLLFPLYVLSTKITEAKKLIDTIIYTHLKSGGKIPNLILTKPTTTRNVENITSAYKALEDHIDTDDIMSICTVKFAELLKIFTKKYRTDDGNPVTKEQAEIIFLEHLEDLVTYKTSKESVKYKPEL